MGSSEQWVLDAGNSQLKFAQITTQGLGERWNIPSTPESLSGLTFADLSKNVPSGALPRELVYCSVIGRQLDPVLELFRSSSVQLSEVTAKVIENHGFNSQATGVGIDRLVTGFAAWRQFSQDLVVIDLGTATTFDVISAEGCFLGGAIFPGVELCKRALIDHAEALKDVPLEFPEEIIGKNSSAAIRSGILFGYTSLVETMLAKITASHGVPLLSIATGGLASLICRHIKDIKAIEPNLTLEGLAHVAKLGA